MSQQDPTRTVSIHLLALPDVLASVLYGLHDTLATVGKIWPLITGHESSANVEYDVRIVSETASPFTCFGGIPVAPHHGFEDAPYADVVIIPDLVLRYAQDPRGRWPGPAAWLREQYARGTTLCSVCTGAFLLADTGLLDGHQATTHWAFAEQFRRCFRKVELLPDSILLRTGEDQRLVVAGGATSWQELALHLVATYSGQEETIRTAKIFLLGDRSIGQLAFSAMPLPPQHDDKVIADCQCWVAENYHHSNVVARMVAWSGLAERTFKRRFRQATGYAPIGYVQSLRIEEARRLLEATELSSQRVAAAVGYEDPASFRRLFKRHTNLTPSQYRKRYRAIGEAAVVSGPRKPKPR